MKVPRNVLQQEIALVRPVIHMPDKRVIGQLKSSFRLSDQAVVMRVSLVE